MKHILDAKQMKNLDNRTILECKVPSMVLMERASMGVASLCMEKFDKESGFIAVCGTGNNGADGIAVSRILHGYNVNAAFCIVGDESKATKEFVSQKEIALNMGVRQVTLDEINDYNVIIDGIFGIGLTRDVEGKLAEAIKRINSAAANVVSVDIPSGINASNGQIMGVCVKADYTVTFGYAKTGILILPGCEFAGEISVVNCGFAPLREEEKNKICYEKEDLLLLPKRSMNSNKGSYKKVLVIAGSDCMSGAAYFSAKAAYRSGCGLVKILTAKSNFEILQKNLQEAVYASYDDISYEELKKHIDWSDIVIVGPGLSIGNEQRKLVLNVLEYVSLDKKVLVDADGLNIVAKEGRADLLKNCVITPHMGEMSRLLNLEIKSIKEDITGVAQKFAKEYQCICVLKDARTVVSDGTYIYINTSGNSGMATAGSGDVLTGIIAGMWANGMGLLDGAAMGVFVHGMAGDEAKNNLGEYFMTANDIVDNIKNVIPK